MNYEPKNAPETVGGLIERLGRELADAKGDAERYRWLRSHPVFQVKELPNELELLDACIDRRMAGQQCAPRELQAKQLTRDPTPAMCAAGFSVPEAEHDPAGVWRAMWDVAPHSAVPNDDTASTEVRPWK